MVRISNLIKKLKDCTKRRKAISSILASVVIFGLIIIGVSIGFFQVIPHVERSQAESAYSSMLTSMYQVDKSIQELLNEGIAASGSIAPTRTVTIHKPQGTFQLTPETHTFNLRFVDTDGNLITDDAGDDIERLYTSDISLGEFSFSFLTNYAFTPVNTMKYLTGSSPFVKRPGAVIQTPLSLPTDDLYQGIENISTIRSERQQQILYNYRPKITIDFKNQPTPKININLFAIRLEGANYELFDSYADLSVKITDITLNQWNRTINNELNEINLEYRTSPNPTAWRTGFTTARIDGFAPGFYGIHFKSYIYTIEVS